MATNLELADLANNTTLLARITASAAIQADVIRAENDTTANHANRLLWAKECFADPPAMGRRLIWPVLAANRAATAAQIEGATDAAILSAVAAAVDIFATGA